MLKTIEVIIEADDKLHRTVWDFWFDDRTAELVLDNYSIQLRKTRRHHYVIDSGYSRLQSYRNSVGRISSDQVPLPDDVRSEAKRQFYNMVSVVKWPDRKD